MFVVDEEGSIYLCKLVSDPRTLTVLGSRTAQNIVRELSRNPSSKAELSRKLGLTIQRVSYHVGRLEEAGIIKYRVKESAGRQVKIYELDFPFHVFKLADAKPLGKLDVGRIEGLAYLRPFVENGKFNALIVIGSPDPHGKYRSASSDGYSAIDLALFLGSFVKDRFNVAYKLDTQVSTSDRSRNLILVGGPKSNMITDEVNDFLPVRFAYSEEKLDWSIYSTASGRRYTEKQIGLIVKIQNPFAETREILVLAGKGFRGTRAAIVGFIRYPRMLIEGNRFKPSVQARVVRGLDVDSDGIIDDVEFLE